MITRNLDIILEEKLILLLKAEMNLGWVVSLTILLTSAYAYSDPVGPFLPWGIHMAYGNDPTTSMAFVWSTRESTRSTTMHLTSLSTGKQSIFTGNSIVYSDSNNVQTIHTTNLTGLEPGVTYNYNVGDEDGNRSSTFQFSLHPVGSGTWRGNRDYPVFTIYGDMGVAVNAHKSLPLLYQDLADGKMDVILHVGDIACE